MQSMEQRNSGKNKSNKKSEIVRYIFKHKNASKTELTKALELSMPTVLQTTKELLKQKILLESGEYESTGGRRAKSLIINGEAAYAVGLDVTSDHVSFVLINVNGEILTHENKMKTFSGDLDYYRELFLEMDDFIKRQNVDGEKILGIGVALPGIIDNEEKVLIRSNALNLENVGLQLFRQMTSRKLHFENDANAAMMAESEYFRGDAIYLFLSNTVGGAFQREGSLFRGNNRRAGEFGHAILVPNGRECYCGKKGCTNAYCSAQALEEASGLSLEETMARVAEKDPEILKVWNEYLDYLAITISNIRMIYDTDIILGGDVGAYLEPYMPELGKRVMQVNKFDSDTGYLRTGVYKKGSAAVGAAMYFIHRFIDEVC